MQSHLYMLRDLKGSRGLEEGDDLSDLAFMEEVGPHETTPLVVEGNVIIDGVRRLHKAQQLGWDYVYAFDPKDVYEAAEALALNHSTPLRKWHQVGEIVSYMRRLNQARIADRRIGKHSPKPWTPVRDLMTRALGGLNSSHFEKVNLVLHDPILGPRIDAGKLSPAGAYAIYMKRNKGRGDIVDHDSQLEIYQRSIRQLHIAAEAVKKVGPNALTREEAVVLQRDFRLARNTLNELFRRLEEAFKR